MTRNQKIVRLLDNWRFWNGIAFFGIACVVVALWINFARVSHDQARTARIVAVRHADVIANADSQYTQCVKSIPTLQRINRFLGGVEIVHSVLVQNSIASHKATPPGSPLYLAQEQNIRRLRRALDAVKGVSFPVPTAKGCVKLRDRLEAKQ